MKSALDELKDASSQPEERKTAKQKILGFLYKAGSAIGDATVKGLSEYLTKTVAGL